MDFPHQELTGLVIAAAIAVPRELRPGLDEKLYERALCIEFEERGICFTQQPRYEAPAPAARPASRGGAQPAQALEEEAHVEEGDDLEIPSFLRRLAN